MCLCTVVCMYVLVTTAFRWICIVVQWLKRAKQHRRCPYNVTLRDVHELLLPWERNVITYWSVCAFRQNSSSGSRVVPRGRTEVQTDGWTDMTNLIDAFRNFANAPKNSIAKPHLSFFELWYEGSFVLRAHKYYVLTYNFSRPGDLESGVCKPVM
jgi:hypothetical protein